MSQNLSMFFNEQIYIIEITQNKLIETRASHPITHIDNKK